MIESCGVPHTEVDLIIADGCSIDFSHLVNRGDYISVFPVFESFDITPIVKVRPEPLRETRFVADNHLGRLARFLRLLGFDTSYEKNWDDPELARISAEEQRIILTRDVGLLKRSAVTHGYYVRAVGDGAGGRSRSAFPPSRSPRSVHPLHGLQRNAGPSRQRGDRPPAASRNPPEFRPIQLVLVVRQGLLAGSTPSRTTPDHCRRPPSR